VNIWQSYKQERGCLMHFASLANTLLKDEESARDNDVLVCNFAKYSPFKNFSLRLSNINVSRGSVATYARCDEIFNILLTANLPRNLPMKKILIG